MDSLSSVLREHIVSKVESLKRDYDLIVMICDDEETIKVIERFDQNEITGFVFRLYPETGLTPKQIEKEAEAILATVEFFKQPILIFTHSEQFTSWLAVLRNKKSKVVFVSISRNDTVPFYTKLLFDVDPRFDLLEPNHLTAGSVHLYEKEIERGLGGNSE